MFEGYHEVYAANARLAILRTLAEQGDWRMSVSMLETVLASFAISKGRAYVLQQLGYLEDTLGAVRVIGRETPVPIAELCSQGLDHVEGRVRLEGVERPAPRRG